MYPELFKIGQFTGRSIKCHSCEPCLMAGRSRSLTKYKIPCLCWDEKLMKDIARRESTKQSFLVT